MSVIYYFQNSSNQISITNNDKYLKSIPDSIKKELYQSLYVKIKDDNKLNTYKSDTIIREKSFSEKFNKNTKIYNDIFIIDIPSIKESFKIHLSWSPDSTVDLGYEYLNFSCLEKSEVIYNDFNCEKSLGLQKEIDDNIIKLLPYSTFHYSVALGNTTSEKIELKITIYLYSSDTRNSSRESAINKYKTDFQNWMNVNNLSSDNYKITYIINE